MKKLIILDYTTGICHCYSYDTLKHPKSEDVENLIDTLGHNIDNCDWMVTNEEIITH